MAMISSTSTKLEEITVSRQSSQPRAPSMITTARAQAAKGRMTQRGWRKITARVTMMNSTTPMPNTTMSLAT